MPEFLPGEVKTAVAPITVQPVGLVCDAELYLSPVATSGKISFVSTGLQQTVRLPVMMPAEPGIYPVYLDIHVGVVPLVAYQAIEDVVIVAPLPFTYSNVWVQRVRCDSATAWNTLNFGCTITNPTDRSITHTLTPMYRVETKYGYGDPRTYCTLCGEFTLTLKPGQSYNCNVKGNYYDAEDRRWRCATLLGFSAGVPYGGCALLRDENGNDSPQACV